MAYYDRSAAKQREKCRISFEDLKKKLQKESHKNHDALDHIKDMELKMLQMEDSLNKYRDFFISLKQFI